MNLIIFVPKFVYAEGMREACAPLKNEIHDPTLCCNYPRVQTDEESFIICENKCSNTKDFDKNLCCLNRCLTSRSEVFANETFNSEKLIESFSDEHLKKVLSEASKETVTNAVSKCEIDCKFSSLIDQSLSTFLFPVPNTDEKDEKQCQPWFFYQIMNCVMGQILLACPNFETTKECEIMKNTVEDCVKDGKISNLYLFINRS